MIELALGALVDPPAHPFRLGREMPFVRIESAKSAKARSDFCLSSMGAIVAVKKLRGIGDLPSPSLSTSKGPGTGRHPQHRRDAVHVRADEIPLASTEIAGLSYQGDKFVD